MSRDTCRSPEELRRIFLAEESSDSDLHAIDSHVQHCPRCQKLLDDLGKDQADELREAGAIPDRPSGSDHREPSRSNAEPGGTRSPDSGNMSPHDGPIEPDQILFGRYKVLSQIGEGGMGEVWLVCNLKLGRESALKFILPRFAIHDTIRVRFSREARVTAGLTNEHIVAVYDADLSGDAAFIEMQYVRGQSLNKLMRPGVPMPLDWISRILDQLCDALQEAHEHQIVHRDLKPSNLMLLEGRPPGREFLKVLDFGIAKILNYDNKDSGGQTMTGGFLGTVHYASPEQLLDQPVDGRSDLYATGVMLYEMLTGYRPFGGTAMEQMHAHAYLPPPPMAAKNPEAHVPPEVEQVVMRCLAKDPAQRPQSARALADEFRQALEKPGVVSVSPGGSRSVTPPVVNPVAPTETAEWAAAGVGMDDLLAQQAKVEVQLELVEGRPSELNERDYPDRKATPWLKSKVGVAVALLFLMVAAGLLLLINRGGEHPKELATVKRPPAQTKPDPKPTGAATGSNIKPPELFVQDGTKVGPWEEIEGRTEGGWPVVLVKDPGNKWRIQSEANMAKDGAFTAQAQFGLPETGKGAKFQLVVVVFKSKEEAEELGYQTDKSKGPYPGKPRSEVITVVRK